MGKYHINTITGNPGACSAKYHCPYGGLAHHFGTPQAARDAYEEDKTSFPLLPPMKMQDSDGLKYSITLEARISEEALHTLNQAILFAEQLHEGQIRKATIRGKTGTPYIEHPLRNTLRLIRMGVTDVDVLVATVLHDTVEDCTDRFQQLYGRPTGSVPKDRAVMLRYIAHHYSPRAAGMVAAVSNEHLEPAHAARLSRQEKNAIYRAHVQEEIFSSPEVFMVKLVDYFDNAGGLHHAANEAELKMAIRQAEKYLPLIDVFRGALDHHDNLPLYQGSRVGIQERLERTRGRLIRILEQGNARTPVLT